MKVDIFPLGLIFYYLLNNGAHAYGDDIMKRQENIDNKKRPTWKNNKIEDKMMKQLIKEMIKESQIKRPPAEAVLSSPYFYMNDRIEDFFKETLKVIDIYQRDFPKKMKRIEDSLRLDLEITNWTHSVPGLYEVKSLPDFNLPVEGHSLFSLLNVICFTVRRDEFG